MKSTGAVSRCCLTLILDGASMPLHLWASTRSPAVLASQGRAMPARSAWAVAPSKAARSPTYVGSSATVMSARALMRG
eukprot:9347834-Pyramimonas_sp.AAC.1